MNPMFFSSDESLCFMFHIMIILKYKPSIFYIKHHISEKQKDPFGHSCMFYIFRFHHLKLYPEDESGPMSTKKPVIVESYDEIVFPEPSESLLSRMQNYPAVTIPRLPAGFTLPPPGMFVSCINHLHAFFYFVKNK